MDSPHSGMLNQAAARKFGVREDDPPPLAGFFGKDMKSKRWDGVAHESAWFRIRELLMGDEAGEEARLRQVLAREAQWGVTSITLLEVYPTRRVQQLSEIDSPLRIRLVPFLEFQESDRRKQPEYPPVPAHLADRVSVSGLKYLLDGTPEERSAATRVPYADDPTTSGQMDFLTRRTAGHSPRGSAAECSAAFARHRRPDHGDSAERNGGYWRPRRHGHRSAFASNTARASCPI